MQRALQNLYSFDSDLNLLALDKFFPKAFVLDKASKLNGIEWARFYQEFRVVYAESLLKKFDGELTLQDLVAFNIAVKRLNRKDPEIMDEYYSTIYGLELVTYVTDDEWKILQMPK